MTILLTAVGTIVAGLTAGWVARRLPARLWRGAAPFPPWCEVGLAAGWGAIGTAVAAGVVPIRAAPLLAVLSWLAVVGSAVDLRYRRLPDALTLPALPAVLLALLAAGPSAVPRGAGGAALLAGGYAVVHLAAPRALGAGDVKLALPVGAALAGAGWPVLPFGVALSAVLGVVVAGAAVTAGRAEWRTRLPHGPVLLAAALVAVTLGVTDPAAGWSDAGTRR